MRMIHEVAADIVMRVAEPVCRDIVRQQQEARILDCARGEDEDFRRHRETSAGEAAHAQALDPRRVRACLYGKDGRVGEASDVAGRAKSLAIGLAETRRRAEAVEHRLKLRVVEGNKLRVAAPQLVDRGAYIVAGVLDLAEPVHRVVVGRELARRKRPAALRNPGTSLEIDIVQGTDPAAPGIGIATEIAELTGVEIAIGLAQIGALAERLGFPIEREPAAFEEAEVDDAAAGYLPRIDEHRMSRSQARSRAAAPCRLPRRESARRGSRDALTSVRG